MLYSCQLIEKCHNVLKSLDSFCAWFKRESKWVQCKLRRHVWMGKWLKQRFNNSLTTYRNLCFLSKEQNGLIASSLRVINNWIAETKLKRFMMKIMRESIEILIFWNSNPTKLRRQPFFINKKTTLKNVESKRIEVDFVILFSCFVYCQFLLFVFSHFFFYFFRSPQIFTWKLQSSANSKFRKWFESSFHCWYKSSKKMN